MNAVIGNYFKNYGTGSGPRGQRVFKIYRKWNADLSDTNVD
jgi:hypothetical protein